MVASRPRWRSATRSPNLYPLSLDPVRALRLARQGLASAARLTVDDELRATASDRKVSWDKLVAADAAEVGSRDHTNLRILTRAAAERVEARMLGAGARVLAWNPGVLVRYGELAVVDRLRARAGLADSDLQTLWLVVFGSTVDAKPLVDGEPVPVLGASEWPDITDVWLTNRHRHHAPTGTDASTSSA